MMSTPQDTKYGAKVDDMNVWFDESFINMVCGSKTINVH